MYDTIICEYEGKFGRGRTVDDIVDWVESIPPMPEAANKALKLVDDPNSSPHEIAAVLARDPAIVSTVMRAANSAALGRSASVTALEEAILVVGLGSLKSLILGLTLKRWNKQFGDVEKLIWQKSLATSAAAYVISTSLGKTYQEPARLCGLLHNIGQIVMLSHPEINKQYPAVLNYIRENETGYAEAEREIIGFSHPLIGAMVAKKWQLPMSICTTILRHADPFDGIDNSDDEQTALIQLSVQLSTCSGLGYTEGLPLVCDSLLPVGVALGFEAATFEDYKPILAKQTQALYATENNIIS